MFDLVSAANLNYKANHQFGMGFNIFIKKTLTNQNVQWSWTNLHWTQEPTLLKFCSFECFGTGFERIILLKGEGQHEAAGSNKSFHFCPESGPSNASGPTLASLMLCPCFTFVKPIASTDWRSGMLHLCFTFASLLLQILSNSLHQLLWNPETFVTSSSSSSWFDSRPFPFVKLKLF